MQKTCSMYYILTVILSEYVEKDLLQLVVAFLPSKYSVDDVDDDDDICCDDDDDPTTEEAQ